MSYARVPWALLCDATYTKFDVITYAIVQRMLTADAADVSAMLNVDPAVCLMQLRTLASNGFLREVSPGRFSSVKVVQRRTSRAKTFQRKYDLIVKPEGAADSVEACLALFHHLYKDMYHVDCGRSTIATDLRELELVLRNVPLDLLEWCIRALFSPAMSWLKIKKLSFLFDPTRLAKHVVPVAVTLKKEYVSKPEWSRDLSKTYNFVPSM